MGKQAHFTDDYSLSPIVLIEHGDFLSSLLHNPLVLYPWLRKEEMNHLKNILQFLHCEKRLKCSMITHHWKQHNFLKEVLGVISVEVS